jgi:hypothetical protein
VQNFYNASARPNITDRHQSTSQINLWSFYFTENTDVDMLIIVVAKAILGQIFVKFIKVLPFDDTKYYPPLVIPCMLELLFIHKKILWITISQFKFIVCFLDIITLCDVNFDG